MKIEMAYDGLSLQSLNTVRFGRRRQRISLAVANPDYPRDDVSDFVFSQFGSIYFVSALLPAKIVTTNYALAEETKGLLRTMYESCGKDAPKIISRNSKIPGGHFDKPLNLDRRSVIVPFSGGKDGLHHYFRAKKENLEPRLVHVQNMNLACASEELRWAKTLAAYLRQNLEVIRLKNGTPRNGFNTMRFRDMFIVALMIPYNVKFDARNTVIEGFADQLEGDKELFSGKEENMFKFNELLRGIGFPVNVMWYNMPELQVIRWLIENQKHHALAKTNSCFAYPLLKVQQQRDNCWPKFPGFPFYESQCGACFKCYIVNLARIAFRDVYASNFCPKNILDKYVRSAERWLARKIKEKGSYYNDPSFSLLLELASGTLSA